MDLPASFDQSASWPEASPPDLSGMWTIEASIDQSSPHGAPVRMRASLRAEMATTGAITLHAATVEPSSLKRPQADGWPTTVLKRLASADALSSWYRGPRSVPPDCVLKPEVVTAVWRKSPDRGRWTLTAQTDDRPRALGWVERDQTSPLRGRIELLRWLKLDGSNCQFQHTERYTLTLATP